MFGIFSIPPRYWTVYISLFEPKAALGRTINLPFSKEVALIVPILPTVLPILIWLKFKAPFTVIVPLFWISTLPIYAFGPFIVIAPADNCPEFTFVSFPPATFILIFPVELLSIVPPLPVISPIPVELLILIVPSFFTREP